MALHCVIGSGPAGVACATALLRQGAEVLMLDAGLRLEPERAQIVENLKRLPSEQWDPQAANQLKEGMDPGATGIPEKRIFGSDFPYRDVENQLGIVSTGVGLRASLAFGGLSTVWGAAMLPYVNRDIADWPIASDDLARHYQSVLEFTGLAGEPDGLAELFPAFTTQLGRLEPSRQAKQMLAALAANQLKLKQAGIHYGRARVAIKAARGEEAGCTYCGFCMYGCPYGYIYRSDETVARLQRERNFRYEPDVVVQAVAEDSQQAIVTGHHRATRAPLEFKAHRVYLAAGVVPTTRILLRSLSVYDRPVQLKDSQYFLLPVLLRRRVRGVRDERLHALSQIFLELNDAEISPHTVHLQVYSYNDLIGRAMRKAMGPLARLGFLARGLEDRLLLIQGFIHSAHSSQIEATLRRGANGGKEILELKPAINPAAKQIVRRVVHKLVRHGRQLGIVPLSPMLQVAEPGRSFHVGGSFPMRVNPAPLETDRLGRPAGWHRVHAVDATVFPSVAATTITFTAMANAHRIGWETAALA